MNKDLIRSVKFTLFSVSAGVIQIGSFTLLNELLHLDYWVSYLIALILSVLWNFTLNRRYTFQSANNVPCDAEGRCVLSGFYAGLDASGKLADDRSRLE